MEKTNVVSEFMGKERVSHAATNQTAERERWTVPAQYVGQPAVPDGWIFAVGQRDQRARVGADFITDFMHFIDDAVTGILKRTQQTVGLLIPFDKPDIHRPSAVGQT